MSLKCCCVGFTLHACTPHARIGGGDERVPSSIATPLVNEQSNKRSFDIHEWRLPAQLQPSADSVLCSTSTCSGTPSYAERRSVLPNAHWIARKGLTISDHGAARLERAKDHCARSCNLRVRLMRIPATGSACTADPRLLSPPCHDSLKLQRDKIQQYQKKVSGVVRRTVPYPDG